MIKCLKASILNIDKNIMFIANDSFKSIFEMVMTFLKEKCTEKTDLLAQEVIMLSLSCVTLMINSVSSHQMMNDLEIIKTIIKCL